MRRVVESTRPHQSRPYLYFSPLEISTPPPRRRRLDQCTQPPFATTTRPSAPLRSSSNQFYPYPLDYGESSWTHVDEQAKYRQGGRGLDAPNTLCTFETAATSGSDFGERRRRSTDVDDRDGILDDALAPRQDEPDSRIKGGGAGVAGEDLSGAAAARNPDTALKPLKSCLKAPRSSRTSLFSTSTVPMTIPSPNDDHAPFRPTSPLVVAPSHPLFPPPPPPSSRVEKTLRPPTESATANETNHADAAAAASSSRSLPLTLERGSFATSNRKTPSKISPSPSSSRSTTMTMTTTTNSENVDSDEGPKRIWSARTNRYIYIHTTTPCPSNKRERPEPATSTELGTVRRNEPAGSSSTTTTTTTTRRLDVTEVVRMPTLPYATRSPPAKTETSMMGAIR